MRFLVSCIARYSFPITTFLSLLTLPSFTSTEWELESDRRCQSLSSTYHAWLGWHGVYIFFNQMPHLPLCCCVVPSFCRYLCLFFSYESSTRTLENNNPWIFKIQDKRVRVCRKGQNLSPEGVVLYNCSGLVDMQMLKEGKEQILLLMWVIITSTFPIWGKHFNWASSIWFIIKLAIYFILHRFKAV